MAERSWTKPQKDAITAQGGAVLVSAAAGSGKTAVLVERAIRLICDEDNPVPADRLLVVTFSNAAAAEMKQRMNMRLSALIAENPANIHLQRQQALLQSAQISTIHSFCLELIRQNFQHLDISPDFALADPSEMEILELDCARECIEEYYQQDKSGLFPQLVELLSTGRDDRRLVETILKIYRFSRSHPFYTQWLDEKAEMYDTSLPVEQTVWGRTVLDYAVQSLEYCIQLIRSAIPLIQEDPALEKGYGAAFQSDLAQLQDCLAFARHDGWDGAVKGLAGFIFQRLGAVRGSDGAKERAKAARDRCKKVVGDLTERYMNATSADFRGDIADLQPKIQLLFSLVKRFGQRLWEAKGERKMLDFSDLEHLALQLLVRRDGDHYVRTTRAEEIAARFLMIMVDEYQDTNEVQELIFSSVSQEQNNLFMVGDVKQSIYSFRQAMPEIFLRKKQAFFPYDTGQFPAKIILDTNFRSRSSVTDGVNYLFRLLMSQEMGEMDYDDEESLKCGAEYPACAEAQTELLLFKQGEEEQDHTTLEAEGVAEKIASMLRSKYLVMEGGEMRPSVPGDYCILLRSHKNRAESYVQALLRRGIAARAEVSGGFLQNREVSMVVSLLKALDNPLLDVELAAVLLSPLFAFTDDDIARIRMLKRGVPFYVALTKAALQGEEKANSFLQLFAYLRTWSAALPADRLLLQIYDSTDAIAIVRAMPLGENRAANLQLLVEYAASYHKLGYKRLGGFVGFLNRLEERGGDLAPAGTSGANTSGNAVRVMSIHRSKGLEFPVVILADTFRRFNKVDLYASTLLHSSYGFACVRREEETLRQYSTVPMQAIRLAQERSLLSEELRVLYVALTRAREKLIVTGFLNGNLSRRLSGLLVERQGHRLPPYAVRDASCYADWILMALLNHKCGSLLREMAGGSVDELIDDGNPWHISLAEVNPLKDDQHSREKIEHSCQPDLEIFQHLKQRAEFRYPYQNQVMLPTKLGVSTVAKGEQSLAYRFSARPKFMSALKLTAAERGNALHKFMQFADYHGAKNDLDAEIQRMAQQGFLTKTESDSLNKQRLRRFFNGDLAHRIFASDKVLRELKFTAECGQDILGDFLEGMDSEAKIVLQGVADCVFFEASGAVIVDYKTDRVKTPQELVERYSAQLSLYRRILSNSLNAPISQCLLYSFSLGTQVEILP